jgi:hypothetical protein
MSGSADRENKYRPDCGQVKALTEFTKDRRRRDALSPYCRACHNTRGKAVDVLVAAQDGRCAICREAPPEHVDHDHRTGRVLGILCFNCNGGLGQFRDRDDLLTLAIAYLRGEMWADLLDREGVFLSTTSPLESLLSPTS